MTDHTTSLSRRRLLQAGSATLAAGFSAVPALAKGPMLGTQAPYFYRLKLGNAEATVVSDGPLPLGDPHKNFLGLTGAEMDKQLTDNWRTPCWNRTRWCSTPATGWSCSIPASAACRSSARPPES
jgi:hypothetical protein